MLAKYTSTDTSNIWIFFIFVFAFETAPPFEVYAKIRQRILLNSISHGSLVIWVFSGCFSVLFDWFLLGFLDFFAWWCQ